MKREESTDGQVLAVLGNTRTTPHPTIIPGDPGLGLGVTSDRSLTRRTEVQAQGLGQVRHSRLNVPRGAGFVRNRS